MESGLKSGFITQFQESGLHWVAFVWCLSQRLELALYTINSLSNQTFPPLEIWELLFCNQQWKDLRNILLIAALCLCVPFSNAAIQHFFSQMRIVKTDWQNKLNEKNLSSLLYIKTQGPTLTEFHNHYCSPTKNLWLNDNDRRLNQRKRKKRAVVDVKLRTRNDSIHLQLEFCLKDLTVEILFKRF